MVIRRIQTLANDHLQYPATCKWTSGGTGRTFLDLLLLCIFPTDWCIVLICLKCTPSFFTFNIVANKSSHQLILFNWTLQYSASCIIKVNANISKLNLRSCSCWTLCDENWTNYKKWHHPIWLTLKYKRGTDDVEPIKPNKLPSGKIDWRANTAVAQSGPYRLGWCSGDCDDIYIYLYFYVL